MEIKELCARAHNTAVEKGFYGTDGCGDRNIGEMLMLIVSELGEAIEAHRKGDWAELGMARKLYESSLKNDDYTRLFRDVIKDSMQDEIADAFIRLADLCSYMNIDIESHILAKMKYNDGRETLHGKKY